jgi:hypothetical protein
VGLALLVALGAALRLWQYAADASLWADEADMALNLVTRSPAELLAPLQYRQVAPVGWLLAEKAAITVLGDGELALRLIPLLASLAALPLFVAVARRTLEPRAVVLALALFALSPTVIFYAAQVKPYASDIAVALLLLGGVLDLDRRGADGGRAERLGVLGALVVWVSHPAVLLLSGLGAVLALQTWRARGRREGGAGRPVARMLLLWAAGIGAATLVARRSLTPDDVAYLGRFWAGGFMPMPPRSLRDLVWPLVGLHNVFAGGGLRYPLPGVFSALAALGALALARRSPGVAVLLLAPVGVALAASAVRAYPFSGRTLLFLCPVFLLLVALGAETLWALRPPRGRWLGGVATALCAGLAAFALVRNLPPYRPEHVKPLLAAVERARQPGDRAYVYYGGEKAFRYYAARYGLRDGTYVVGGCWRDSPRDYLRELDRFRGAPRVWLLVTHALPALGEDTLILGYLDRIGVRRLAYPGPSRERGTGAAAAYLYDLSNPARLGQASSDTYAVPPRARAGGRGAWSC